MTLFASLFARIWVGFGAIAGVLAVAGAAALAHLPLAPEAARLLASAVQMQGWHALALVGCGAWSPHANRLVHAAGAAFVLGLLLFCGDILALVLAGLHLGVAPAGGILLMAGWAMLGLSAIGRPGASPLDATKGRSP